MKIIFYLLWVLVLLSSPNAFADKIYLRNGEVIHGTISKETKYSVKLDSDGKSETYYRYEIDRVEKDQDIGKPGDLQGGLAAQGISEEKKKLIRRLLDANGAKEGIRRIFLKIVSEAPEENRTELKQLLNVEELVEQLIPIYADYYTDAELKELIAFYSSATGQKVLKLTPALMQKGVEVTSKYFREKISPPTQQDPIASP
ncbi:MAG: DUF2059 domain-containing protein [Candidatus Omnitrophica bacterium]|nr:DUF2059 domain-containing protein [Candidatus Omnitrophota bacterium]